MAEDPARTRTQRFVGYLGPVLLVLGFIGAGLLAVNTVRKPQPYGEKTAPLPALVVPSMVVEREPGYELTRRFIGAVEPARRTEASFERNGKVAALMLDEGERVAADGELARLDTERLEAERDELDAQLRQAEAERELARLRRERTREAFERNAVATLEWDEAREGFRAAEAAVARLREAIDLLEVELRKSVLYAPYDAVVTRREVDEGAVIAPGQPVYELLEWTAPEARIGVAGNVAAGLQPGDARTVLVEGVPVPATVRAVLPRRDAATRTRDVRFALDTTWDAVAAGDLALLALPERVAAPGFWLPLNALTESRRGLWACYVLEPLEDDGASDAPAGATHRVARREIELVYTETERAYVQGTLESGDTVVTAGIHRLSPGLRVQRSERPAS